MSNRLEGSAANKADVEGVKAELQVVETALKTDIVRVEFALRTEIATARAEIARFADRTFNRLGALIVVVVGSLFAALHMWPH
jgi:hypothetical protein